MNDTAMQEAKPAININDGDSNLDFCTGDDFLSISHSAALVSPSGAEFDLIVKVKPMARLLHIHTDYTLIHGTNALTLQLANFITFRGYEA